MINKSEKPIFKVCEPNANKECNMEILFLGSRFAEMLIKSLFQRLRSEHILILTLSKHTEHTFITVVLL